MKRIAYLFCITSMLLSYNAMQAMEKKKPNILVIADQNKHDTALSKMHQLFPATDYNHDFFHPKPSTNSYDSTPKNSLHKYVYIAHTELIHEAINQINFTKKFYESTTDYYIIIPETLNDKDLDNIRVFNYNRTCTWLYPNTKPIIFKNLHSSFSLSKSCPELICIPDANNINVDFKFSLNGIDQTHQNIYAALEQYTENYDTIEEKHRAKVNNTLQYDPIKKIYITKNNSILSWRSLFCTILILGILHRAGLLEKVLKLFFTSSAPSSL
jgi:hypothetical protein